MSFLLFLLFPLAWLSLATRALHCPQGEYESLSIVDDGSEVLKCGTPPKHTSNDTTRAPSFIASYVLVDDDNLRNRLSKNTFYSQVAMDTTTDNRVCRGTTYNRKGVAASTTSGRIWRTTSTRHADNTWRFFPLGRDARNGVEYFDVSTICVSRGVYFPVLHWEDAPTTRRQHIYLFLAFDPKGFPGLTRLTEYRGFNAVHEAYGHRVHIGNILRGLQDGDLSLSLLTRNIQTTDFRAWDGGWTLAFDAPNASRDWAEMGRTNGLWADLRTLFNILRAIYPWLILAREGPQVPFV